MKYLINIILFIIITFGSIKAQIVTTVAPLKAGNTWVYITTFPSSTLTELEKFEVLDSMQLINGIPFYVVRSINSGFSIYDAYYGIVPNQLFARYDTEISDSLYTYFKTNPQKGDTWEQRWKNGITLYNTIIDTFTANVFNKNTLIYTVDRRDSILINGSREYWTKEYGMLNGIYEWAEDILIGCVIDGVLYGDTTITGIDKENELPDKFVLYQNYPNPFNSNTVISFQLLTGSKARLEVYDILGERIKTLTDEYYRPGKYNISFNAEELPSGIYFFRFISENFVQTKKMILIR